MKTNKAFTLAEVLIVLMTIGAIAALTLPNLMKGVDAAQRKAGFQKAFTAVSNIAATEKVGGQLPSTKGQDSVLNFFASMSQNLSVKEYVGDSSETYSGTQKLLDIGDAAQKVTWLSTTFGDTTATNSTSGAQQFAAGSFGPWIITDDGLAYTLTSVAASGDCSSKAVINEQATNAAAMTATCVIVMVDTNGLAKGPNKLVTQVVNGMGTDGVEKLNIDADRFYIFLGNDGVAPGPKAHTVSGRIMADMK